MEDEKEQGTTVLSGSFDLTATLPNQAQFSLHGYIYANDTDAELHARVDRFQDLAQRTILRAGLEGLRANRKAYIASLENQRDHLKGLLARKESGLKLTSQEKTQADQIQRGIDAAPEQLKKIEKDIVDLEERLKT